MIALVWDMSCDAIETIDNCATPNECFMKYWPGDEFVDWTGVNVFQAGRGKIFSSMPNSTCVLDFADESNSRGFPVMVAESLPRFTGTTNNTTSWDSWFQPFFGQLLVHPGVAAWSYINRDCRPPSAGGTRTKCVGGLWGDARIETPSANFVGLRYQQAITDSKFVHANTLHTTCKAIGVKQCMDPNL